MYGVVDAKRKRSSSRPSMGIIGRTTHGPRALPHSYTPAEWYARAIAARDQAQCGFSTSAAAWAGQGHTCERTRLPWVNCCGGRPMALASAVEAMRKEQGLGPPNCQPGWIFSIIAQERGQAVGAETEPPTTSERPRQQRKGAGGSAQWVPRTQGKRRVPPRPRNHMLPRPEGSVPRQQQWDQAARESARRENIAKLEDRSGGAKDARANPQDS